MLFLCLCTASALVPFKNTILCPGLPESKFGVDSRRLKKCPSLLLSTNFILLISVDEYCSNVKLFLEGIWLIDKVTRAAFLGALKIITESLSVIFQSEGYEI